MSHKYTLMLDPGHGGTDPGAVKGNRHEKDFNLKVSLYQYNRFKQLGVSVGITRTTDKTLSNTQRTALAKQGKYCISNHLNAGGGDRGEVIHSIYDNGRLANEIKDELIKAGQSSVKVYYRKSGNNDYYYMHRETGNTITQIVEYCFLDNEKDFAHFNANWEAYAEAVVKAFCQHIRVRYTEPITEKKSESNNDDVWYQIVTGSFRDRNNAEKRIKELKAKGFDSFIQIR